LNLLERTGLLGPPYGYGIATPHEEARRGGHVAVTHPDGARIARALKTRGFVPDFRPPDIVPPGTGPAVHQLSGIVADGAGVEEIVDAGEHRRGAEGRDLVA
jgi:kynureninase